MTTTAAALLPKFDDDETDGGRKLAIAGTSMQDNVKMAQKMGYLHVQSLAGGFDTWAAAGRPVAKPSLPAFD